MSIHNGLSIRSKDILAATLYGHHALNRRINSNPKGRCVVHSERISLIHLPSGASAAIYVPLGIYPRSFLRQVRSDARRAFLEMLHHGQRAVPLSCASNLWLRQVERTIPITPGPNHR